MTKPYLSVRYFPLFNRRFYSLFCAVLLLAPTMASADIQQAQQMVIDTTEKTMAELKQDEQTVRNNPDQLYAIVDKMVLPHFDFQKMSSWVLGKYWRKATPSQKERFTQEFQKLLVRTYSNALLEAIGKKIDFLPLQSKNKDATEVTVRTEVQQQGGFPIPIDYKMYLKDGQWKVFDVVIDNLSLVSNYRTSFSQEIKKSGIDKLIDSIAEKNNSQNKSS